MTLPLRDVQSQAVSFAKGRKRCAWLLRPGQGKTLAAIALIRDLLSSGEAQSVLVLAPIRVAHKAWVDELKKWAPEIDYVLVKGSPAERAKLLASPAPVKIVSHTVIDTITELVSPDVVILDELSSYKSGTTKRTKAAVKITMTARYVVGMTGTPAADSYLGLWSQMKIIDGGARLGKFFSHYRERYFRPTATLPTGQPVGWELKYGCDKEIQEKLADITFTPEEDLSIRPEIVEDPWHAEVAGTTGKMIRRLQRTGVVDLTPYTEGNEKLELLAETPAQKLNLTRQLSAGTVKTDIGPVSVHTARRQALLDCLERFRDENAVIAYWYQNDLEDIKSVLPDAVDVREPGAIDYWNTGGIKHLTLHPQSAGHGLNLQHGGRMLVWYTLPLSCELWQQTNARLARPGGGKKVGVIPLILDKTSDSVLLSALKGKQKTERELLAALETEL